MAACVKGNKLGDALRLFSLMKDSNDEELLEKSKEEEKNMEILNSLPSFATFTFYPLTSPLSFEFSPSISSSISSSSSTSSSTSSSSMSSSVSSSSSSIHSYPPLIRDTYSYGTALHALGKKGAWKEAFALLENLRHVGPGGIQTGRSSIQRTTIMVNYPSHFKSYFDFPL